MRSDTRRAAALSGLVLAAVTIAVWVAWPPAAAPPGADVTAPEEPGPRDRDADAPDDSDVASEQTAAPATSPATEGGEPARSPGQRRRERESRPGAEEMMARVDVWDAATAKDRMLAARGVLRRDGLELNGLETFEFDRVRHELPTYTEEKTGLDFVLIPAGSFVMGVPKSDPWASEADTAHLVTLTRPFLMSRTEVTADAWNRIMGEDVRPWAGSMPVVSLSWNSANAFCERAGMRLPTEAQWEYACRAGTTGRFYSGDTEEDLARIAWCKHNSGKRIHPVAQKPANAFGLHDTHGNVLEWVRDGFAPFDEEHVTDPTGAVGALLRVIRGGSFEHGGQSSTAGNRHRQPPWGTWHHVGFRPVIELP